MKALNVFAMLVTLLALSLFFFPFEIKALPGANTKMLMAGGSLLLILINMARRQLPLLDKDLVELYVVSAIVSIIGLLSVVYNDTHDYTYATYIVSMSVWLAAAYTVVYLMRTVHGSVSVRLLSNYLIVLCVCQCGLALAIDYIPVVKAFANQMMDVTPAMEGRLYGIDASLDIAGSRFSAVLIMIMHCCLTRNHKNSWLSLVGYICAFFFICIVGNMISRSTIIGVGLSIFYLLCVMLYRWGELDKRFLVSLLFVTISIIIVVFLLCNIDNQFYYRFRFGFEGFFSLVEKGRWEVSSNEILKNMVVYPETLKTWIIGDGYFDNPYYTDPLYLGKKHGGYYMSTDIGYLRFIFYFGVVGLLAFSGFFCKCFFACINKIRSDGWLLFLLLVLNFIMWFKVSTDLFLVFALFLFVDKEHQQNQASLN